MFRRLTPLLTAILLLTAPLNPVFAQTLEWDGLETFENGMIRAGMIWEPTQDIDWKKLNDTEVIVIVAPENPLNAAALSEFVNSGGTLVIFDDFGAANDFYSAIQAPIRFVEDWKNFPLPAINGNPELPVLTVTPDNLNPAFKDVSEIAFNHPRPAEANANILIKSGDIGFIYAWNIGNGRIFAILDASIVNNLMLSTLDNGIFIRNLLDVACAGRKPCKTIYIHGDFQAVVHQTPKEKIQRRWENLKSNLANARDTFDKSKSQFPWNRIWAIISSFFFLIFCTLFLPWKREK